MFRKALIAIVLVASVFAFSTQFKRTIEDKIVVQHDGSAIITRTEYVPASDLSKVYIQHRDALRERETADEAFANFYDEISKGYFFLYRSAPGFGDNDVKFKIEGNGNVTSTISMKVTGLISESKEHPGSYQFSSKNFSEEKIMLKYLEDLIDGKAFETAFLGSSKNSLLTTKTTTIVLPEGSEIIDLLSPHGEKPSKDWSIDLGGGTKFKASLDLEKNTIILKEEITTGGGAPKNLMNEDNEELMAKLRDYAAYIAVFNNEKIGGKLSQPEPYFFKEDYSGSWNFGISHNFSTQFAYQTLSVEPGLNVSFTFGTSLLWEHQWKKVSWWKYKYVLKKFQTTVSLSPSLTPYIEVSSGAALSKTWEKNITTKTKWITFWVSCVPVTLVMEVKFDAKAEAGISGVIGFTASTTLSANTTLTVKYENGWSKNVNYSANYSGLQFDADAKVNAWAKGSLPLTLSAYVYYVAGPFVQFVPWLKGETNASAGSSTQVGYKVTAGFDVNGGVHMAGWLKDLCDGVPSVSYTFWNKSWTIANSTLTF
ncbi:MAG TPA: hypothetical protein PK387_08895 [Mesotoga prima]|uniref:hypothetical protein n=1 Tax=Mesotoga prima TaxID=1184387 RepID=UPI002B790300|nr:hypothetical protein [Mesotoga prima]HNQ71570.1 hypothetical protein [Mesotoga prima]HPQ92068.1 hypothetical protein [Mesotoga prima]